VICPGFAGYFFQDKYVDGGGAKAVCRFLMGILKMVPLPPADME
jgi:hypothetical protein